MKIRRIEGQIQVKTDEEIIELLKNGNRFYLLTEYGEALVSVTLPKKPSLSDVLFDDPIDGVAARVKDIKETVKDIKEKIKKGCPKHDWIIKMIDEKMGDKIVDKEERK